MNGPGTSWFARDDASQPRQPSLYRVDSTYVVEAQAAAADQQNMFTALTAAIAIAAIWFIGKMK